MRNMPLGRATEYPRKYAPGILCPVARGESRGKLGIGGDLPFAGVDIWNAYELTWLEPSGKPAVGVGEFVVPATSPSIVESKSLKLYLASLAMHRLESVDELAATLAGDLSEAAGADVEVRVTPASASTRGEIGFLPGDCIDGEDAACGPGETDLRALRSTAEVVEEELHSHLLRSLCPVTGQPDCGSVLVRYRGPRIDRAGLLEYIVSYREHNDFHEACVERMYLDIKARCRPERLSVYARYNRRGGIDINPFRSDFEARPGNIRLWRQ